MTNIKDFSDYFPYPQSQIRYLVNCSKKYRFIYVETPKVACSTIKRVLQIIEVDGNMNILPKNVHDRQESPLLTPYDLDDPPHEIFTGDKYFRFSFVRNPYTRILSAYLDKIVKNQWERNRFLPALGFSKDAEVSFLQFLQAIKDIPHVNKDIHWTPQSYILQRHRVDYHFIGRMENFSKEFARVILKIKPDADSSLFQIRADHHKTSASQKVQEYIGKKERDLIIDIFENDFEVFRYSLDPHFAL